jgi:hypothetical protein
LQRHGISRLPDMTGEQPAKKQFKADPIGYFHIASVEVRAAQFLQHLMAALPYKSTRC